MHPQAPASGGAAPDTVRIAPIESGFAMHAEDRKYEVRGIVRRGTKLKAMVKGIVY